ncbi:MAG: hypothetical protein MP439_10720 [Ferrimicrobium sp.]|nr:hypothetical protein [Ferrimicrobium sp.]
MIEASLAEDGDFAKLACAVFGLDTQIVSIHFILIQPTDHVERITIAQRLGYVTGAEPDLSVAVDGADFEGVGRA